MDIYIKLSDTIRADLAEVKKVLMSKAELTKDPLVADKEFIVQTQQSNKTVNTFADDLKLLFCQAYPSEAPTSGILLQRFLTELKAPLSRQILLQGKPTTFEQAVKEAGEIEYALNFESKGELK